MNATNPLSTDETASNRLIDHLVSKHGFRSPDRCRAYFDLFFGNVRLYDRTVLDIGCGKGWLCLYAASQGAADVVGLEPMVDGSVSGDMEEFQELIHELGLTGRVEPLPFLIQEFDGAGRSYDVILMRSAINHLDEPACMTAHKSEEARERYRQIFRRLNQLMPVGGTLVATDVSRHNFWGSLKLRNPFAPTIEWEKHQSPYTWASILRDCGFDDAQIHWGAPATLHPLGPLVLNPVVAYFFNSKFRLVMKKVRDVPADTPRPMASSRAT